MPKRPQGAQARTRSGVWANAPLLARLRRRGYSRAMSQAERPETLRAAPHLGLKAQGRAPGADAGFEGRFQAAQARGDVEAARAVLEAGAAAGDAFACGQLGVWRLLGHGVDRDDGAGFRLVRAAARAGERDAQRLLATLYARGRGVEASWPRAVEWLVRAAEAGDPDPIRQLAFLLPPAYAREQRVLLEAAARGGDLAARRKLARLGKAEGPPVTIEWARIAQAVRRPDLPDGISEIVRESPAIRTRRAVLDADLCDYLICAAVPLLARARVNDPARGADRVDDSRTNSFANFWLLEGDVVTDGIDRMLARLVGAAPATGEPMSILHYAPGEQFAPHFDYFEPDAPAHAAQIAAGGQRVATCLVYLNDAFEGGATAFVDLDLELRGAPGAALFWRNVDSAGAPDRQTRHAGIAPTSGEKWLLSKWFRDRPQTHVRAPQAAG